jgi:hypothetical protein
VKRLAALVLCTHACTGASSGSRDLGADLAPAFDGSAAPGYRGTIHFAAETIARAWLMPDGRRAPVQLAQEMRADIEFIPVGASPPDFRSASCTARLLGGAGGPPQPPRGDAGSVIFSGFHGGPFLFYPSGKAAALTCTPSGPSASYVCAFGVTGSQMMPVTIDEPFPLDGTPLRAGDMVGVSGGGGRDLGSFAVAPPIVAPDTLAVVEDLTKLDYPLGADTTLHFTCADAGCGDSLVDVTLIARSWHDDAPMPGDGSWAVARCTGAAQSGAIAIPSGAIAVLAGASPVEIETHVHRADPPATFVDATGDLIVVWVGQGVGGITGSVP